MCLYYTFFLKEIFLWQVDEFKIFHLVIIFKVTSEMSHLSSILQNYQWKSYKEPSMKYPDYGWLEQYLLWSTFENKITRMSSEKWV